jgi:hypothetical protein
VRLPFPGMDPWLELPALWLDVHNSLIASIRDELASRVAPKYYVGIEQHTYVTSAAGDLVGIRPDIYVGRSRSRKRMPTHGEPATAGAGVLAMDVEVPVEIQVEEWYLEVRVVGTGRLVTVIEVLSPLRSTCSVSASRCRWRSDNPRRAAIACLSAAGLHDLEPSCMPSACASRSLRSRSRSRRRTRNRRWTSTPCCMPCTSGRDSTCGWTTPSPQYRPWKRKTPPGRGRSSRDGKSTTQRRAKSTDDGAACVTGYPAT